MNHNLKKEYYEYFAKLILEGLFPDEYRNIELKERPDLWMSQKLGIEVTRAPFSNSEKANALFQKINGKTESEIPGKILALLKEQGCKPYIINSKCIGYSLKKVLRHSLCEIKNSFEVKLHKLQCYELLENYSLFVYSPGFFEYSLEEITEFCSWCISSQKKSHRKYQNVIIYDYTSLFVCNLFTAVTREYKLDKNFLHSCDVQAIEYANQH